MITQKQEEYLKKIGALQDSFPVGTDSTPPVSHKTHPISVRIKAWFSEHRNHS